MFFDTETTGLPTRIGYDGYYPPEKTDKYDTSRVVELAYLVVDSDTKKVTKKFQAIIKPNGEYTTDATAKFHGISTKKAENEGRNRDEVLDEFCKDIELIDTIVGHNVNFDYHIVASELLRSGRPNYLALKDRVCTMNKGKSVMRVSKSPKLVELYAYLFNKSIDGVHTAMGDTNATMECYFKMINDETRLKSLVIVKKPLSSNKIEINVPLIQEPKWTFASHKAALPEIYEQRKSGPVNMKTMFTQKL